MKKWPVALSLALLTLVPHILSAQVIEWQKRYGDFSPQHMIQWGNDRLVLAGKWDDAPGALLVNFNGDSLAAWRGNSTNAVRIQGMTLDTSHHVLVQFYQNPAATTQFRLAVLDSMLNLQMENPSIDAFGLNTRQDGTVDLLRRETYPINYAGEILSVWPLLPSYSPTFARDSVWTVGFYSNCWLDLDTAYRFGGNRYVSTDYHQSFATIQDTNVLPGGPTYDPGSISSIHKGANGEFLALASGYSPSPPFSFLRFSPTLSLLSSQIIQDPIGNEYFELTPLVATDLGSFLTLGSQLISGSLNRSYFLLELDSLGNRSRHFPLGDFTQQPLPFLVYAGNGVAFVSGVAADSSFSLTKINLLAVGIEDPIYRPSAFAYPNPCSGHFSLLLPEAATRVRVYDALGRCVCSVEEPMDGQVYSLPGAGVYVWVAELRGGGIVGGRVVGR